MYFLYRKNIYNTKNISNIINNVIDIIIHSFVKLDLLFGEGFTEIIPKLLDESSSVPEDGVLSSSVPEDGVLSSSVPEVVLLVIFTLTDVIN